MSFGQKLTSMEHFEKEGAKIIFAPIHGKKAQPPLRIEFSRKIIKKHFSTELSWNANEFLSLFVE